MRQAQRIGHYPVRAVFLASTTLLLAACAHVEIDTLPNDNHDAAVAHDQQACADELEVSTPSASMELLGRDFTVAVWNTKKGRKDSWQADFAQLREHDLVLLQELRLAPDTLGDHYYSATPGFQRGAERTGVATLSRVPPLVRCELSGREPILRTTKATSITLFALDRETSLAVVNLHAVNFAVGLNNFRNQIGSALDAVAEHRGPLIVSGDFNTWRGARMAMLMKALDDLGARPVAFAEDWRSRVFGLALDHVFVRGLEVVEAATRRVRTSDHNPMLLKLRRI